MTLLNVATAQQAVAEGLPEPFAYRYIYLAGTDTLATLYADPDLSVTVANPMQADESGRFELCFLIDGLYRIEIYSRVNNLLQVEDNVSVTSSQDQGLLRQFEDISALLADQVLSYAPQTGKMVASPGQVLKLAAEGYAYRVADEAAADHHVTTAGGLKLYVQPDVNGARNVRAFGVVGDAITDDGPALQRAFDLGGRIVVEGHCVSNQPLLIEKTSAHLVFPAFQSDRISVGPSFPEGEHLLTVRSVGRRQGGDHTEEAFLTGNERYFTAENMFLDGSGRTRRAHGLYLSQQVDDLTIQNLLVHDFKGVGVCCGSVSGSAIQDEFRESMMHWMHVKNCGHLDPANGRDYAAVEMSVHDADAPIGAINNIQLGRLKIAYPRGVGLRFKSLAPSVVKPIRAVAIDDLFIHGNESLTGTDPNGEAWHSGADLMELGHAGATGSQIAMVKVGNLNLVEQESGQSGIRVYHGSQLKIGQAYLTSAPTRYGIRLTGAGNCSISQILTRRLFVNTAQAFSNLIKIDSMASDAYLHIGTVLGGALSSGAPNFEGDLNHLRDDGRRDCTFTYGGDSTANQTTPATFFGNIGPATQYVNKITLLPMGNLTPDNTDYATITLQRREPGVAANNITVFTTQTSGGGGTGFWGSNLPIDIPISAQSRLDAGMICSVSISKNGAGVTVPPFLLLVETSFNVSVI